MKESSKSVRSERKQKSFAIGAKLTYSQKFEETKANEASNVTQRKKLADGSSVNVQKTLMTPHKDQNMK